MRLLGSAERREVGRHLQRRAGGGAHGLERRSLGKLAHHEAPGRHVNHGQVGDYFWVFSAPGSTDQKLQKNKAFV